jgi:flagellar basal-body rod modification protein FlgD
MSSSITSTASASSSQTLNQADFLKLLVTQMSSQDPLNPQSDTDFAAQLAQFSSLQETQNMQSDLQSIQATGLIGSTVTVTPSTGSGSLTGTVSSVDISSGTPEIMVNGNAYELSQITSVTAASSSATSTSTQN